MYEKGTISVQLVNEALFQAGQRGFDTAGLAIACGIDPACLEQPQARVTTHAYANLWRALALAMDDEFFGMNPRRMKCGSFAYISAHAVAQSTLQQALAVVLEGFNLVFDGLPARLQVGPVLARVELDEGGAPPQRAFTYFTFWLLVHGLLCWLARRRVPIASIALRCAQPGFIGDYQTLFTPALAFAQPTSALLFEADVLHAPVRRHPSDLKRFLAAAPRNILERYRDSQSVAARIRGQLRHLAPADWPDMAALARSYHMAPATLRRRLDQEGESYQVLKDRLRQHLALELLASPTAGSLLDIALAVGFTDTSAFYKAFRKWTGEAPGQYRARLALPAVPGDVQNAQAH